MSAKIRKGDIVIVITGKDKGKTGEVLTVFPKESKAKVTGIHIVKKHQKATRTSAAGIVTKEAKIHLSNLAFLADDGKASRVGFKFLEDGSKVRFAKRTGQIIVNKVTDKNVEGK